MQKDKVEILSNEEDKCPYCNSKNINYGAAEFEENMIKYPCECLECKRYFEQWYVMRFAGNNVGSNGDYDAAYVLGKKIVFPSKFKSFTLLNVILFFLLIF